MTDSSSDISTSSSTAIAANAPDDPRLTDLRQEKIAELQTRYEKLFGLQRILPSIAAGIGGTILLFVVAWALLVLPRTGLLVNLFTFFYMLGQGIFLGYFVATLLVGARLLSQLAAILTISLSTLKDALTDLQTLGHSPARRADLMGALIQGALVPAAQSLITVKLGLIRLPLSFLLNRVLKRATRRLTRLFKNDEPQLLTDELPAKPPTSPTSTSELTPPADEHYLDHLQTRLEVLARRTRIATLGPTILLLFILTFFTSLPWLFLLLFI